MITVYQSASMFSVLTSSARKIVGPINYVEQPEKKREYFARVLIDIMRRILFHRVAFHEGVESRLLSSWCRKMLLKESTFPERYACSCAVGPILVALIRLVHNLGDWVCSLTRCRRLRKKSNFLLISKVTQMEIGRKKSGYIMFTSWSSLSG